MCAYLLPTVAWLIVLAMILHDARKYERTHPQRETPFGIDVWK